MSLRIQVQLYRFPSLLQTTVKESTHKLSCEDGFQNMQLSFEDGFQNIQSLCAEFNSTLWNLTWNFLCEGKHDNATVYAIFPINMFKNVEICQPMKKAE